MLRDYREHYKPRRQIDCGGVIIITGCILLFAAGAIVW